MKRNVLLLICTFIFLSLPGTAARYTLVFMPGNPYSFGSRDLWNLQLISDEEGITIQLKAVISTSSGTPVMEALSAPFTVKQGYNMLNAQVLKTLSLRYQDRQAEQSDKLNKSLPSGNFSYCIEVLEGAAVMTQQCEERHVELISPPILVNLENQSVTKDRFPFFSWLPPIPVPAQVSYRFTLVELFPGQPAVDGILRNRPLHQVSGLGASHYRYPMNAPPLTEGKRYAWQVKAENTEAKPEQSVAAYYAGESEVWEFTYEDKEIPEGKIIPYAVLGSDAAGRIHPAADTLKFIYQEPYAATVLDYYITDEAGRQVDAEKGFLKASPGENRYELPIWILGLMPGKVYTLKVVNDRKEIFLLQFRNDE